MAPSKKIRAVFVLNDFIIGGVQRLYLELFEHLDRDRYELHLITCMDIPGRVDLYDSIPPQATVHRLAFRSLFDLRSLRELATLLRSIQPDVVLASLFFSTTVTRVAALMAAYPIIAIEQNVNSWKNAFQVLVDWLLAFRTHTIIAASRSVAAFFAQQARIPARKFVVIHNGINIAKLRERALHADVVMTRAEYGYTSHERIIINVARLTEQKNHPMLIDAFARFSKEHPDYRLLILGEGPKRSDLEARIKAAHLEGRVVLAGAKQNVVPYYGIASCFVSSSFIEGFGIAHAEALALGLPVITTKTAGPDEMVQDGVNGLFVETTVDGIYEGLVRFAQHGVSASKDEISASVAHFDSPKVVAAYDDLMTRAVG